MNNFEEIQRVNWLRRDLSSFLIGNNTNFKEIQQTSDEILPPIQVYQLSSQLLLRFEIKAVDIVYKMNSQSYLEVCQTILDTLQTLETSIHSFFSENSSSSSEKFLVSFLEDTLLHPKSLKFFFAQSKN